MLDYASVLLLMLAAGSLAMIIMVLMKRRSHSAQEESNNQEEKAPQQTIEEPPAAESEHNHAPPRSSDEVEKAREELRALNLQRQMTASALTAIFEAESQGKINRNSRDSLIETYKDQMEALDEQIVERKKITELSDLLYEREELIRGYKQRIGEIEARLQQLNSSPELQPQTPPSVGMVQDPTTTIDVLKTSVGSVEEKKPVERVRSKTEERIHEIKEEVLKAIERLEKIESEG